MAGSEWENRLRRQKEFFKEGNGNFLVFAQYEEGRHGYMLASELHHDSQHSANDVSAFVIKCNDILSLN
jgi:hypothetical protein